MALHCFRARVAAGAATLSGVFAALYLQGCGREDIRLFPALAPHPMDAQPTDAPPTDMSPPELADASSPLPVEASLPELADASAPQPTQQCGAAVPEALLASRPPMGWNGYNAFGSDPALDEAAFKAQVEALVASGMQAVGYQYVNLDIGWQQLRTAEGERVFDAARLPGGIQALSDWVHARGLSLGVYSHVQDCFEQAGGAGYEAMDAANYAAWGVDYVKYVHCPGASDPELQVTELAAALASASRPIVLSLAMAPFEEWMSQTAQLWRVSGDAQPTWSSIVAAIDAALPLAAYARPGAFNDPDMLEIGNGALSEAEQRAQFSVWSILSAPLLAGNDLTQMTDPVRAILTHSDLIAFNQDPLGLQAARIRTDGDLEILAKPLAQCGARAVVLWNRGTAPAEVSLTWEDLWLEPQVGTVRDLWSDSQLEAGPAGFSVEVAGHDAVALRVDGGELPLPQGTVPLSELRWTYVTNGYGPVELNQTNGETEPLDGAPIRLRGVAYDQGLGVHSPSLIRYQLGGACSRFSADVGIDDDQDGQGSAQFEVWADGERLFQSAVLTGDSAAVHVDLDVSQRLDLRLFVGTGGDGHTLDHAVWAGALLECEP